MVSSDSFDTHFRGDTELDAIYRGDTELWTPAPTFLPSDIGNLRLWVDAPFLGLANGALINSWTDRSGNAFHMTPQVNDRRPTYQTNVKNGLAVVRFDATNDALVTTMPVTTARDNFTMWAVQRSTGSNVSSCIINNGTGGNGWGLMARTNFGAFNKGILFGGITYAQTSIAHNTNWTIWCMRRSAGSTSVWLNGGSAVLSGFATTPATPGTYTNVGWHGGGAMAQDIGECVVYENANTLTQINQMGTYFANKWGLTWTTAI